MLNIGRGLVCTLLVMLPVGALASGQDMCFGEYQTALPQPTSQDRERARQEVEREREAAQRGAQASTPDRSLADSAVPAAAGGGANTLRANP